MCPEAWNLSFFFHVFKVCHTNLRRFESVGYPTNRPRPKRKLLSWPYFLKAAGGSPNMTTPTPGKVGSLWRWFPGFSEHVNFREPYGILWNLMIWTSDFSQVSTVKGFNWGKFIILSVFTVQHRVFAASSAVRMVEWTIFFHLETWNVIQYCRCNRAYLPNFQKGGCFAAREKCMPFLGETWRLLSRLAWFTTKHGALKLGDERIDRRYEITRPWSKHGKNVVVSRSEVKRTMSLSIIWYELDVCIYDQWSCIFLCIAILEHFKHEIRQATKGTWSSNQNLGICWSYLFLIT